MQPECNGASLAIAMYTSQGVPMTASAKRLRSIRSPIRRARATGARVQSLPKVAAWDRRRRSFKTVVLLFDLRSAPRHQGSGDLTLPPEIVDRVLQPHAAL